MQERRGTVFYAYGCLLCPLLFSVCINDIEEYLDGGGVLIGSRKVKIFARADDLMVLASEVQSLLRMIGWIFRSLKFDIDKSQNDAHKSAINGERDDDIFKWKKWFSLQIFVFKPKELQLVKFYFHFYLSRIIFC